MTITELNEGELQWIASLIEELRAEGIALDASAISEYAERRRAEWATSPDLAGDPNVDINRVGAAVGEILVRGSGLAWVVVDDEYGTELGVLGQPNDILLFPMNAVAKRLTGESSGTVLDFVTQAEASISRIRALGQQ
jgi:hypothetical protein